MPDRLVATAALFSHDIDPEDLLSSISAKRNQLDTFIDRHRLHGLLWRNFKNGVSGSGDSWVRGLKGRYDSVTRFNQAYFDLLEEITASNSFVLLKGADLIFRTYEDPGLRPLDDLDLLVDRSEADASHQWLESMGFREWGDDRHRAHGEFLGRKTFSRFHPGLGLPLFVEIHSDLRWMFHRFHARLAVERGARLRFRGNPILALHPEDHFLYLAVHWLNHWRDKDRILWGCDLAWMVQKKQISWEGILARAKEMKLAAALVAVLARLVRIFPRRLLDIPAEALPVHRERFFCALSRFPGYAHWGSTLVTGSVFPPMAELLRGVKRLVFRKGGSGIRPSGRG